LLTSHLLNFLFSDKSIENGNDMIQHIKHTAIILILLLGVLSNTFAVNPEHDASQKSNVKSAVWFNSIKV